MPEWREYKIGDKGCSLLSGYAFKSTDYRNYGIPLIKIGNIQNRSVSINHAGDFVAADVITPKIEKFFLKNNDVLIAMTGQGSVGRVGKLKLQNDEQVLLNQRVGKFICDEKNLNIEYLYHVLTTEKYQDILFNAGAGSGQPNLSPEVIMGIEIPIPDYTMQKSIASVLSSLDDKIDLLHRQNKTLEALAETLFRQWFVEEAEEGWETGKLGDYASVSTGKGLKRNEFFEDGKYPVLGANGEIGRTNNYLTDDRLILTGRVGTLGKVYISEDKVWISDNVLIVRPESIFFYPVYFILKRTEFENLNVGSTQPLVTQTDLKNIEFKLPSADILESYEKQCLTYFEKISKNKVQIRTLTRLRDTLLPKLMSGDVRVKD